MRFLLLLTVLAMTQSADAAKRPMTLDDLFKFKRVAEPQISPDGKQVVYQVGEILDVATNKKQTHLWLAATDGKTTPRQITSSGKADTHPRWSPDGTKVLFESNRGGSGQLYVLDLAAGGEAKKLTSVSTDAATGVWSPDGKLIAFVSAVYPEFSELPFVESDKKNTEKDEAIEKNPVKAKTFTKLFYRHWDSYVGDKRNHLFVITADGKDCRDVTPGDRDAYPTSTTFSVGDDFTFTPDGKHILFTAVPEKGEAWSTNHDICRVSIDNKSTTWESLTGENKGADVYPKFSPDGKKLAWRSQKKAGYEADKWVVMVGNVKPDGTLAGKGEPWTDQLTWGAGVTPGGGTMQPVIADVSVNDFAWLPDGTMAVAVDETGSHTLYHLTAANFGQRLRSGGALGGLAVAPTGLAYTRAHLDAPAEVCFRALAAERDTDVNLSHANDALLAELERPRPESVKVKIEDGEMQMWILKPPGFDEKKKWPVAFLVHGGPQGAWEDAWSFRWNPQLWAAQGYVVVLPNPRGSTGFGQKFVDEISGDWGGKCYRDLVAGLEHVKKLPYVDKDRMGSAGASFGGYMQDWFAVNEIAKDFKCLISHCSVYNFESMWGTTEELWFDEYEHGGLPWEIPGKYREFSPHTKAGNLGKYKTPMLLIQNDLDFRCPVGQGIELFTALQRQGVPSRFVNFPDEGHWVLKPANSKHWHTEVFAWLTKYVPPGGK
ncbi:dipeptidyl-peptidase 5 [Limnoglobus roseus]|uniref:S9 family peptidase n=1 Tax=Limnoglobus roseus TaxID=2598579 RepID=A0A5C1A7E4_9BACT|nr:S9 family peptidase [Limnoglobus roseus]QEL14117.1 S9 family peptidase [Limnoglobus roseus]